MKKITFLIGCLIIGIGGANAQTTGSKISREDSKWSKGGIYSGYHPSNEILQKRSANSKHFANENGTVTVQIGDLMHYQDQRGYWQDIDLTVIPTSGKYGFSNETNNVKSYFPQNAGSTAVKMKVSPTVELNWWKSPEMRFTADGKVLKSHSAGAASGLSRGNSVLYHNVYSGISEEFETLHNGLENNTIINSLNAEIRALPTNAMVEFSQIIELGFDWKVAVNGKAVSTSFSAPEFTISIPGLAEGLSFSKIVIFDNAISKAEALNLVNAPKGKLSAVQLMRLQKHVFQSDYVASFVDGGLKITSKIPVSWLQKSDRSFPVTVDPTVTIGQTADGTFYGPMTHWYGFQRYADLYLNSEIGGYGAITAIEYYKTNTAAARTKPTKVFMRSTPATVLTGGAAWNSTTYTGGLTPLFDGQTTQDATVGWKMITLTTPFPYSSGNLLVMINDQFGGSGSAQYMAQTNVNVAGRQAYNRADTSDPGNAVTMAVEDRLQTIRITYASEMPTITSFTPETTCSNSGSVVITGTGFAGTTAVTVGGTAVTSFVVNSATQITATVGAGTTGIITVTNTLGTASSATNLTINQSPVVDPIAGGAATVCIGQTTSAFTNATTGGTWNVINGTGTATIDANGVLTGVTAGNVTVTYTVSNADCATTVSTAVTVDALPPAITVTPTSASICAGTTVALTANGANGSLQGTIGTATTLTSTTEQPTAFCNRWPSYWSQTIYTAAELTALGFTAGNITSLSYNITTLGDAATNANFTVKIGTIASTNFANTTFVSTAGFTTVYGPSTYTHTASGWNEIVFSTPYPWDGSSNIVVNVTYNGANALYNSQTYYTETTDNKTLWVYSFTGATTTGNLSTKRLNTRFNGTQSFPVSWTPITNLFTDPEGTIPYATDFDLVTVYAVPQVDTQYTATITNDDGCESTATTNLTINTTIASTPVGTSPQEFTSGQTLADLVVAGDNLHWYSDAAGQTPLPLTTLLVDGTTYYVSQTPTGECESELLAIVADETLGTNEFSNGTFTYYPNPVTNFLTLKYTGSISNVSVINLVGQQVFYKVVNATESQIDMSTLAAGAYLLRISADNATKTIKIIKN